MKFVREIKFLCQQVKRRKQLLARVERLDEKALELFKNNLAVKRYVAITKLRESYGVSLKNIRYSIEDVASRIHSEDEEV